jgi:hypothetical protein
MGNEEVAGNYFEEIIEGEKLFLLFDECKS